MKVLSWINFLLGLWLIVAAFAIPVRTGSVMAAESIAGIVVVVLAYASAVGRPRPGISWSVAIAGLWIVVVRWGVVPVEAECDARRSSRIRFGDGECHLLPLAGTN